MPRSLPSRLRRPIALAAAAGLAVACTPAEPAATGPDYVELMAAARLPGLSVAVVEGGEVVSAAVYGLADAESGEPVTAETLFEAASLSKPVFAAIVLRMAERGELDLDRPLVELLAYERIAHEPRAAQITARHVLSHQTGLPNWGGDRLDLAFDPGTGWQYSGEGYVYLQRVVESISGLTLDELARREIFEPLGMRHSRFALSEGEEPPLARPHGRAGAPVEKRVPREGNAAASLHTTAVDYARFLAGWGGGEIVSEESSAAAFGAAVAVPRDGAGEAGDRELLERIAWGLGWGLDLEATPGPPPLAWHWGDNGPAKAFVAWRPATGRGVVYLANGANGLAIAEAVVAPVAGSIAPILEQIGYEQHDAPGYAERLAGHIAESEGRYQEAISAYRAALASAPDDEVTARRIDWLGELQQVAERPVEVAPSLLASYAGVYGPRRLEVVDGVLTYRREGRPAFELIALGERRFALAGLVDFRLEVVVDEEGVPTALRGHYVEGRTDENPRVGRSE